MPRLIISPFRIDATDDQIKRAHRQKVLKHHPDKRKHAGEEVNLRTFSFTRGFWAFIRGFWSLGIRSMSLDFGQVILVLKKRILVLEKRILVLVQWIVGLQLGVFNFVPADCIRGFSASYWGYFIFACLCL